MIIYLLSVKIDGAKIQKKAETANRGFPLSEYIAPFYGQKLSEYCMESE